MLAAPGPFADDAAQRFFELLRLPETRFRSACDSWPWRRHELQDDPLPPR